MRPRLFNFWLLLIVLFLPLLTVGQALLLSTVEVEQNSMLLKNAFTGGLNNPQYSAADLNNDGVQDLVAFERGGSLTLTFLSDGTNNSSQYYYSPEYAVNFPPTSQFMLLRDYNCDGIADLFSFYQSLVTGTPGVRVMRGYYDAQSRLAFDWVKEIIYFPGFNGFPTNLFVLNGDLPSIDDTDGDGDLDILLFGISGSYVDRFENQSVELGYGCDSLIYIWEDNCWGRFAEFQLNNAVAFSDGFDSCALNSSWVPRNPRHAGSTLTTVDLDGDGDREALIGDISSTRLVMLTNAGNADSAWVNNQDSTFPRYNTAVDMIVFPGAYIVDVDRDGRKDMLVSPSQPGGSFNYEVSWWYKNTQTDAVPYFEYQQDDYLVEEMIDLGSGCYPTLFDYNNDGLDDLVLGNLGLFLPGGLLRSSLSLYENVGTAALPAYRLVTNDYLNLYQYQLTGLYPAFNDYDNDGDKDLFLGDDDGYLHFLNNIGFSGGQYQFATPAFQWSGIDLGQYSAPTTVDLDRDGWQDLVIGERNGNLNYYRNRGNNTFQEITQSLGQVNTVEPNLPIGHSTASFVDVNGSYSLFTTGRSGNIRHYTNIDGNLMGGAFVIADSTYGDLDVGEYVAVHVADLNADGTQDFLLGNFRGGLGIYSFNPISSFPASAINPSTAIAAPVIMPNPSTDQVSIHWAAVAKESELQCSVYNVLGNKVMEQTMALPANLDISSWPAGMYIFHLNDGLHSATVRFLKNN